MITGGETRGIIPFGVSEVAFWGAITSLCGWLAQMRQKTLSLLGIAASINSVKDCYSVTSYQSGAKSKQQILTRNK